MPDALPRSPLALSDSPLNLAEFLKTDKGSAWLAVTVDEWEQKILRAQSDAHAASIQGLNGWLQAQARFKELQNSEDGRIIVSKLQAVDISSLDRFQSTALQVPILATEEYVRRRLIRLITSNVRRCIWMLAWRVAVAGLLIEAGKAGIKTVVARKLSRRHRLRAVVGVILDSVLPTVFFGPALGIWHGVARFLPPLWGGGLGSGSAGEAASRSGEVQDEHMEEQRRKQTEGESYPPPLVGQIIGVQQIGAV